MVRERFPFVVRAVATLRLGEEVFRRGMRESRARG
jgi:hypothetical protein